MKAHSSFSHARGEFDRVWENPAHTRIEPPAVDVNALLEEFFEPHEGLRLTKGMLWDAEVKKAWDPGTYIPGVVREGESWGRQSLENGEECFVRASVQRAWKDGVPDGRVLEEVYTSPTEQSVLFFGRTELRKENDVSLAASEHQPLFHVEHAVTGSDEQPLNRWRIVHLTEAPDESLIERQLTEEGAAEWLVDFVSIYVAENLGLKLTRR